MAIAALALFLWGFTAATPDPAQVEIVTADADHFWQAFDDAAKVPAKQRAAVYADEYYKLASPGLRDFIPGRLWSPGGFAAYVEHHRDFYVKARPYIKQVIDRKAAIQVAFKQLKALYPDIKFPAHIYFVIGRDDSAGTTTDNSVILGAEMFATPPGSAYSYAGLEPDMVPFYVLHETIHVNQASLPREGFPLLQDVVTEGTADFIASLVLPEPTERQYADRWRYGCLHEAVLTKQFLRDQDAKRTSPWMYSFKPFTGWPPDMGYWIGYRLAQAYYAKATDKTAALRAMLALKDFKGYLQASGYPAAATTCAPEKPSH